MCLFLMASISSANSTTKTQAESTKVDAFNYVRVKTTLQFDKYLARANNQVNTFAHTRNLVSIAMKSSKRLNRDTLYSVAVVDISDGAILTMPEAPGRYMSVQVINQDGFTNRVFHGGGMHKLALEELGTSHVLLLGRTLVFDSIPGDLERGRSLQDHMSITSQSSDPFTHPEYDAESFAHTTSLLLELGKEIKDNSKAAGKAGTVDPIKQLLVSAYGFGTLPETESLLMNVEPNLPSDGAYSLTVKDVPVDGFWSIAVYNSDGYFEENDYKIYGYGDRTAERNNDGSITLHFGGDPQRVNFIPITDGWNYVVRLYRPREELLNGTWKFPKVESLTSE